MTKNTLRREVGWKWNYSHECARTESNSIRCFNLLQGQKLQTHKNHVWQHYRLIMYKQKKVAWNLMIVTKLQKKSVFGVLAETYTQVHHSFQANKILRKTKILENFKMELNGNWILKYTSCMWHLWYTKNWLIGQPDQQTNWKIFLLETRTRSFCSWSFFYKLELLFHVYISSI